MSNAKHHKRAIYLAKYSQLFAKGTLWREPRPPRPIREPRPPRPPRPAPGADLNLINSVLRKIGWA